VFFKGLEIGQSAELQRTFTQGNLEEYAAVSGDANPVFTDQEYMKQIGYKDTLVSGGLLGGLFSCLLGTELPGRGTNWLKQKFYFPAFAYVEEPITAKVEIIRLRPDKDLVNLRTVCTNAEATVVCKGESLVYVKDLEL
jgi:acyl dehydratase